MKWHVEIGTTEFIFENIEEAGAFVETAMKHFKPGKYHNSLSIDIEPFQEGQEECSKD